MFQDVKLISLNYHRMQTNIKHLSFAEQILSVLLKLPGFAQGHGCFIYVILCKITVKCRRLHK